MQLKFATGMTWLLMMFLAQSTWARNAANAEMNWSHASYDVFAKALEEYNDEREAKNLPAIRAAIAELKSRISRNESAPVAIELIVSFLKAEATGEFLEQQDAGSIPATVVEADYVARNSATKEAANVLREALARYPDSPPVLRAAINAELPANDHEKAALLGRLLDADPGANVFRVTLMRSLISDGQITQARAEAARLVSLLRPDSADIAVVLDELQSAFQGAGAECAALSAKLEGILAGVPMEFRTARYEGSTVEYSFKSDADRKAKAEVLKQVLAKADSALATSTCGDKP